MRPLCPRVRYTTVMERISYHPVVGLATCSKLHPIRQQPYPSKSLFDVSTHSSLRRILTRDHYQGTLPLLIQNIPITREIGHPEVTLVYIIVLVEATLTWLQLPIISRFGIRLNSAIQAEPVRVRCSPSQETQQNHHRIADIVSRYADIRSHN